MATVILTSGARVTRVAGPIVQATGMRGAGMYEVVEVGDLGLVGEVVRVVEDVGTIQVYEDTSMLRPGAPVRRTGAPLSVQLGPGLIAANRSTTATMSSGGSNNSTDVMADLRLCAREPLSIPCCLDHGDDKAPASAAILARAGHVA